MTLSVRVKERGRWEQGRAVRYGFRPVPGVAGADGAKEPAVLVDGLGRFANESFPYSFAQVHPQDRPTVEAAWQAWRAERLAAKAAREREAAEAQADAEYDAHVNR